MVLKRSQAAKTLTKMANPWVKTLGSAAKGMGRVADSIGKATSFVVKHPAPAVAVGAGGLGIASAAKKVKANMAPGAMEARLGIPQY